MEMWTEVLTENVGATHVEGFSVLFNLSEDVPRGEVRAVVDHMKRREAIDRQMEKWRDIRSDLERQRRTRRQLQEHGIEDPPL